jgi:hypothetical protein
MNCRRIEQTILKMIIGIVVVVVVVVFVAKARTTQANIRAFECRDYVNFDFLLFLPWPLLRLLYAASIASTHTHIKIEHGNAKQGKRDAI